MVFGLFSRKQQPVQLTNTTSSQPNELDPSSAQLRTPSPSVDSASIGKQNSPSHGPPLTPSPPPDSTPGEPTQTDLHALILSIPPQTLHTYTTTHLAPPNQPDPDTLAHLTTFFRALVPPPRLHCVRCHKAFFDVENTERSCLVPHDDDSAEVERVSASAKAKGAGTLYETLWGCCGRTVEGDGDMGPPDGWCYEGKHTTDTKRARFRADSTLQDDKLTPCERLRCHGGPARPTRARAHRKRARPLVDQDEDEDDAESSTSASAVSLSTSPRSSNGRPPAKKPRTQTQTQYQKEESEESDPAGDEHEPDADSHMDVDEPPSAVPAPSSPPKPKPQRKPRATKPKPPAPAPASPPAPFNTPKTSSPLVLAPPFVAHSASPEPPTKAQRVVASTKSKSNLKPTSSALKPKSSVASLKPKSSAASLKPKSAAASASTSGMRKSTSEPEPEPQPASPRKSPRHASPAKGASPKEKPRARSRARVKARTKDLAEVVDSSVDGERAMGGVGVGTRGRS